MKKPVPHGSPRPVLIESVFVIMPVKMSLILVSLIISKPKTTGRARLPFVQRHIKVFIYTGGGERRRGRGRGGERRRGRGGRGEGKERERRGRGEGERRGRGT